MTRVLRHGLLASLLLLFVFAGTVGCGKMGPPRPQDKTIAFSFTELQATTAGRCLAVRGKVLGALNNVDLIYFELAPVDTSANCPTCPFNAREFSELSLEDINYDVENGEFFFSYCPVNETDMYRWRLVGRNVYSGLPYALTTPRIVVMPSE